VFDRDNKKGEIVVVSDDSSKKYSVTLATAYALIVHLGTKSWVNI